MDKVEIKQRNKIIIPFLLIGTVTILGSGIGIFFTEKYKEDATIKISFFVGLAIFCYFIYLPVRKLIKNQSIIVFETDSIILNTNKRIIFKKEEIENISVTYVDETGYFLNIQTKETTHKTNISWLDKTPNEIKELITSYGK